MQRVTSVVRRRQFTIRSIGVLAATAALTSALGATTPPSGYRIVDLGTLGGLLTEPTGINAAGDVIGVGTLPPDDVDTRAFLYHDGTRTVLDTLGGTWMGASAINASGQITGTSMLGNTSFHAYLYDAGALIDLGTLGGLYSGGTAINAIGQVTGSSHTSDNLSHAFLYSGGPLVDLGTLGGSSSHASAINAAGQITGSSLTTGDAETHAFLYSGGRLVDLGTLGGGLSAGAAINSAGEITGWSRAAGTPEHAILYSHGVMTDLGTLGGGHSVGVAINDAGQIAGRATLAGDGIFHAFLYGGGVLHDLGTLGGPDSDAWAMNAKGHVTGWAHTGNAVHAYVYKGGAMQDLNALIPPGSGWELQIGSAINDKGQIAGFGVLNGAPRAFLLTPTQSYAAAVLPPINADGSSVFRASRGVVPVKFALDADAVPTCALPPATIAVTRVAGSAIGVVDQTEYLSSADSGSSFRIADCQYVYNLAASALGTGGYRIDIIIDGDVAGHAVFTLR